MLPIALSLASGIHLSAQTDSPAAKPYATLDRQSVTYRGPISAADKQAPDGLAVIGMILPLRGPRELEGKALLAAAQLALEEEQSHGALPDGRKLSLAVRDESGPWGQASSEILKLIEQDHASVLLTSTSGATAHQAEQIANKISFPILTLASDPTTTETNIPWLFRLGPSDNDQARLFSQRIYVQLSLKKVLLITQKDHDSRTGGDEFEKAARALKAEQPFSLQVEDASQDLSPALDALKSKALDAIVIWTDAVQAGKLLPLLHKLSPATPVFLCQKSVQPGSAASRTTSLPASASKIDDFAGYFTVDSTHEAQSAPDLTFHEQYRLRTGMTPNLAAIQIYQAIHLIAAGLRSAGANRVLLRDYFANDGKFRGASTAAPFDPAGNSSRTFTLKTLEAAALEVSASQ